MLTKISSAVLLLVSLSTAFAGEIYSCADKKKITYEIQIDIRSGQITVHDDGKLLFSVTGRFENDCGSTSYGGMACYRKFFDESGKKSGYVDTVEDTLNSKIDTIYSLVLAGQKFKGTCQRI